MNKVLQVELFGVLSEIDGVHILVKTRRHVRLRGKKQHKLADVTRI